MESRLLYRRHFRGGRKSPQLLDCNRLQAYAFRLGSDLTFDMAMMLASFEQNQLQNVDQLTKMPA